MMKSIESCFTHSRHPVRVLQFGEGRFMRAFVDYAIDVANEEQGFDGNVVIVTPRAEKSLYGAAPGPAGWPEGGIEPGHYLY